MPMETTTAICSMVMGGVLHNFPGLKVCFAHGGGSYPFTIGRIEHGSYNHHKLFAFLRHLLL
jgi:aminocarboxymuconate-semialdehyde decarboxylase